MFRFVCKLYFRSPRVCNRIFNSGCRVNYTVYFQQILHPRLCENKQGCAGGRDLYNDLGSVSLFYIFHRKSKTSLDIHGNF